MSEVWRDKLLEMQAELQRIAATGDDSAAVVELDQSKVGRLSRMDALQAQAMAQASSQRRQVLLQGIAAALRRVDDGIFGLCLQCDEPINPRRLEFDPTAIHCIDCANQAEGQ